MLIVGHTVCIVMFGLMAGFFYSFSGTVMPGLDHVRPTSAVEAMQGINFAVRTPHFFVFFFLTPLFSIGVATMYLKRNMKRAAMLMSLAGGVYLVFGLVLTMAINVPMNEALAVVPADSDMAAIWEAYSPVWTFWNHARTVASAISAVLACLALAETRSQVR